MAKEFVKGVTVGEATAEENTQPAVSTVETNEEETKQVIRANEEDFIAGLIAAADFASDEEETQRIPETTTTVCPLVFVTSTSPLNSSVLEVTAIGSINCPVAFNAETSDAVLKFPGSKPAWMQHALTSELQSASVFAEIFASLPAFLSCSITLLLCPWQYPILLFLHPCSIASAMAFATVMLFGLRQYQPFEWT